MSVILSEALNKIRKDCIKASLSYTQSWEDSEDYFQDVVLKIIEKYKNEDFESISKLKSFVLFSIKNNFINSYRKNKKILEFKNDDFYKEKICENLSLVKMELSDVLDNLFGIDKEIILKLGQGYKYEDIALMLNINIGTLKSKIFGLRKKLRTLKD